MTFADRLNTLLDERRESQSSLARDIGLSPSAIHSWTKGEKIPPWDTAIVVAGHFGVSLDYLFGLATDPAPPAEAAETEQQRTLRRMVETIGFDEAMRRLMAAPGVTPLHNVPTYGDRTGGANGGEPTPRLKRDA